VVQYLQLGIPSAIMVCLELWAYETMTIVSGLIGVHAQAAQVIQMNVGPFLYYVCSGFKYGVSKEVGNRIGRNNIPGAKHYMHVSNRLAFSVISSVVLLYFIFNKHIIALFTTDPKVILAFESILGYRMLSLFPELWAGYQIGIIKALGIQNKVLKLNLIAYWCINVPVILICVFYLKMGLAGVWVGLVFSTFFMMVGYYFEIKATDWEECARKSMER
jgi:MATE family multidrug resistance protein